MLLSYQLEHEFKKIIKELHSSTRISSGIYTGAIKHDKMISNY